MEKRRRAPGHAAPYGQSCTSCFKSKCKCILRSDGDGCERCHRLKKPCHPGDSIRRQAADNTQRANARIADLEGKLSSLVSLLQKRNVIDKDASATSGTRAGYDEPQLGDTEESDGLDNETARDLNSQERDDEPQYTASVLSPPITGSPGSQIAPTPLIAVSGPSTDASAEDFGRFRSLMLPNFPFIYFPSDMTLEKLQKQRPFLCEAIRCVVPLSASEKRARARKLKHILSEMMFCEEKTSSKYASMDLLLGLLVYIAWGWDHVLSGCSLTRLMTFTTTLVGEMRLDKPERRRSDETQFFAPGIQDNDIDKSGMTTTQILESQRAVLGCFTLSSVVSAYFGEMEPLKWTSQMNEGLGVLEAHQELSDKALVFQVRLQLLATRSAQFDPQASMAGLPSTAVLEGRMFLSQLQDIRASMESENLPKQGVLQAHTHYAELRILEAGSQIRPHEPPEMCPGPLTNMTALPSDSVFCLWKAELAVNACARALLCLPASAFVGASFIQSIQWSHLANCIAILFHLAKYYHDPGADPAVERAIGELPGVLDRLADRLSAAAAEAGENGPDDVLTQLSYGMRKFRSSIDVEADSSGLEPGSGTAISTVPFRNPGAWLGHIWDDLSS
ncbi:C6 transcription factor [Colletotrichum asianum]|uniref:C6 transcription factor n=1 Tax=Colletotrichum asianum TaxID=702518 RepID=A0A8H3ZSN3_9PEZI|nr:C6 transcription factor [Colletotrichum asianum]